MAESVDDRIKLLLESNQIAPRVAQLTAQLAIEVESFLGKPLAGEVAIMFITHVALAIERLANGSPLTMELPPSLLDEVRDRTEDWQFAEMLGRQVEQAIGEPLNQNEIGYIAAHVGALSMANEAQGDEA